MSLNTALTGGQYTQIRGVNYAGDYLVTLCPNTVVFAGQVNADLTTPTSWAQFAYNNVTVGAYTAVEVGQAIAIGTANDITKATYRGRIRKAADATNVYTSESSADFVAGAYFWVINTYDPTYKQSRPDANGVELVDYDVTYHTDEPMVLNVQTGYGGYVDSGTGKLRIAFSANAYAVTSGATVSSYAWTFAGTYTVISGATNNPVVTIDFAPGKLWHKLVVTDSNGITKTRHFFVHAADDTLSPPDTGFDNATISGDLARGWTMTIPAFTGVDSVLRDTFGMVWRNNENYGGVAGSLDATRTTAFVGWLQREDNSVTADANTSVQSEVRFEFTGIGPRMARLTAQLLPFFTNLSLSPKWGEMTKLTPWRGIAHFLSFYSTIGNLCDVSFDSTSDQFWFPDLSTQGGNLATAVEGIAAQINAHLEYAPDGRLYIARDAAYLTSGERAALTTVANYTSVDALNVQVTKEQNASVGIVDGDGAYYNGTSGTVQVVTARAPGHALGEAQGRTPINNQILSTGADIVAAKNELRQRVGNALEAFNMTEVLTCDHPDGYTFLIPSRSQLFTFTLDATLVSSGNVNRVQYDTTVFWLLESVTYTRQGNGTTGVRATYRRLPRIGDLGDDTTVILLPDSNITPWSDPGIEPFPFEDPGVIVGEGGVDDGVLDPVVLDPPPDAVIQGKGEEMLAKSYTHAFWLRNVITRNVPRSHDVTPSDLGTYGINSIALNQTGTRTVAPGAYLLGSSGTSNSVWSTSNVLKPTPSWTKGGNITGTYNLLRTTSVSNEIMIYDPGRVAAGGVWITFDPGGDTYAIQHGTLLAAGGNPGGCLEWVEYLGNSIASCVYTFPSTATVSSVSMDYKFIVNAVNFIGVSVTLYDTGGTQLYTSYAVEYPSSGVWTRHSVSGLTINNVSYAIFSAGNSGFGYATAYKWIDNCMLNASVGTAQVAVSSNGGSTWLAPVSVGTGVSSAGGFDTQRAGTVSYAAASAAVYKASTLGGAYSSHTAYTGANPVCIVIPSHRWTSTTSRNTAVSDPDYIVALNVADSGGGTLYRVNGTTAAKTDITPVAGMTFDNPNCIATSYGTYIAVFGLVGGVYKLYRSINSGTSWTLVKTLTTPAFIRGRRNDTTALRSGGQLYVTNGNNLEYSKFWMGGSPRTMPVTGINGFDIAD